MSSNFDISLSTLAAEVNQLHTQGRGLQEQMGHKLIAIRQLLQERNGRACGVTGFDGMAPVGWAAWVKCNLNISVSHASDCVRYAIDPRAERQKDAIKNKHKNTRSAATIIRSLNNIWPNLNQDDRDRVMDRVIELAREAA
jgi:hypothetical protein